MKNKTPVVGQRDQSRVLDWVYQEEEGEDFLMGKTPQDLPDTWEDEE